MPPHLSTSFEIQKYYQNKPKFNGFYSRNNLPKIKDGAFAINLDECKSVGTHWIGLYVNDDNGSACCNATYFDSCRFKLIPKEIKKFMENENIMTNIEYNHMIQ